VSNQLVNTVTVTAISGIYDLLATATTTIEIDPDAEVPVVGEFVVSKSASVGVAAVGQSVTYTIEVSYTQLSGGLPADGVVVDDPGCDAAPVFGGGDDGDWVLESGEVWVYTCERVVTAGDLAPVAETPVVNPDESTSDDWSEYEFVFVSDAGESVVVIGSNRSGGSGFTGDKNKALIDLPGGVSLVVQVSCSDSFVDGYGSKTGPKPGDGWRVASFGVVKYKDGRFEKLCEGAPVPVSNQLVNTVTVTAISGIYDLLATATTTIEIDG